MLSLTLEDEELRGQVMDVVTILGLLVSVGRGVRTVFAWRVRARGFPRLGALVLHLLELHRVVQLHLGLVVLAVAGVLLLLHLLYVVHLLVGIACRLIHGILIGCRAASCCARGAAGSELALDAGQLLLLLTAAAQESHRLGVERLLVLDAMRPVAMVASRHVPARSVALVLMHLSWVLPVGGHLRL